jgi:predicted metalloprotease
LSFGQKSVDTNALKLCVALQQTNFTTDAEADDAVNKILTVIGASQKPILQACNNINNAIAAVYKGQRYILYDRKFINSLTLGSNKYWSNMFILAHEIGHHVNGHSLDILLYVNNVIDPKSLNEKRNQELEADEFAGFVLAKLGATLKETSKVLSNLPQITNERSSTHPSRDKRIKAVEIGFEKGKLNNDTISNKKVSPVKSKFQSSSKSKFNRKD